MTGDQNPAIILFDSQDSQSKTKMNLSLQDSLFRDVPNPVWVIEKASLRFLDVNAAACSRYGYSRDEFLSMSLYDVRAPGETERHRDPNQNSNRAWEHRTKAGELMYVEGHTFPADDGDQTVLAMIFDVTERVKMEQERTELLKRYQILSEAANDLLWDWDLRTNTVTHNEALVTLYGYDRSHLQEDIYWWASLIHPDDYGVASWSIQEAIREKRRYWSAEYRFKKADGTYVPVFDRGILQTDDDENPVRMIGSIVDLSTRQAAEDERKQFFRLSLDSMLMLDPSGTITQGNAAFNHLAGIDLANGPRHNMRELLAEQDVHVFDLAVNRALKEGLESHFSTSIATKAGQGKVVEWGLITNEARNRLFLIGRDITETIESRKELEGALARSQGLAIDAQAASKAQTEFLQNMSHELRTPMNGLLGTAQLLAASVTSDRQRHFAHILIQSGESLLQILNDILDFSKIESGEIALDQAPFFLPQIVQSVTDLFALTARQKRVGLTMSISELADVTVVGDQFRIRQIINNLVGNAIKFTDQGEVQIDLDVQPIGDRKIEAIITVSDTGIGVDPTMQDLIFQRFVQVDSSLTRRHGGTGLGLSITKTLVELMNGQISMDSELGIGSKFVVRIPLEIVNHKKKETRVQKVHPIRIRPGTKVLIAEDVEVNAIILASWLEERGFECFTASTGREAIDMLGAQVFDGIFLDLHMPDYSGYEVINMVRDLEHKTDIRLPVVAVTASVSQDERQKCIASGFDDYIPKPVMVDDLDRVLSRLFGVKA